MKIYYTCEKDDLTSEDKLKRALCLYLGDFSKAGELCILRDNRGKPRVVGTPELDFSVTHTGEWWICAVGRRKDGPFGIDAELCGRRVGKPDSLSRRFFSPAEAGFVTGATELEYILPYGSPESGNQRIDERAARTDNIPVRSSSGSRQHDRRKEAANVRKERRFLKIWVRKEAYLKYTGEGLAGGMSRFTVSLCLTDVRDQNAEDGVLEDRRVEFVPLNLSRELYAVVCRRKDTADRRIELCRMK